MSRHVISPEEYYYDLYQAEMKKESSKRDEYLIRGCLPYVKRYLDDEEFKKAYGMSRKEFEKLND